MLSKEAFPKGSERGSPSPRARARSRKSSSPNDTGARLAGPMQQLMNQGASSPVVQPAVENKRPDVPVKGKPKNKMAIEEVRSKLQAAMESKLKLSFDQDVKTYKDVPGKRMETYRARRVVSPSEFYLEFAHYPEPLAYKTWFPKLQLFYKKKDNRDALELLHQIAVPGRCYVVQEEYRGHYEWHRVRVHSVTKIFDTDFANVYFLDLGLKKQVKVTTLLELEPKFAIPAAQLFRAYLFDIRKKDGKDGQWSPAAVEGIKELLKGKEFLGLVLSRSDNKITEGMPDFITTLGVALVEKRKPKVKGICSLNAKMVDMGWAVAAGPFASCKHLVQLNGYAPVYLDLPPQVAEDEPEFYEEEVDAIKDEGEQEDKLLRLYYNNAPSYVPPEFSDSMAQVDIVYIRSPTYIIVHQEYKVAELNAMNEHLEELVAEEPPLKDGQPGMPVACYVQNNEDCGFWCRGVILNRSNELKYRILMADHGSERESDVDSVRILPEKFHQIPSFAIRLHLDSENVIPVGCGWGNDAIRSFREYCCKWDAEMPRYFMFQHGNAETIKLNQYVQTVVFTSEKKWKAGPERATLKRYQAIDHMKDHPLLHSLFHSVGADLHYEIFLTQQDNPYWYFMSITDNLVENKHAIRTESRESVGQVHVATSEEEKTFVRA